MQYLLNMPGECLQLLAYSDGISFNSTHTRNIICIWQEHPNRYISLSKPTWWLFSFIKLGTQSQWVQRYSSDQLVQFVFSSYGKLLAQFYERFPTFSLVTVFPRGRQFSKVTRLGETQLITKSFQLQSTCTVQATGNGIWGYVSTHALKVHSLRHVL